MSNRVLKDWLDSYVDYVEETEPPSLFKIWAGVAAICAALQRKCYSNWETRIYPNMYIVLVAPGGVRKGTAMRPCRDILTKLGIKMAAEAITREALIVELHESMENAMSEDKKSMVFHSSLTVFSEELTVFLGQNNWQLMSDLNNWFDCMDVWKYRTKNSGEFEIMGVWLNLFGATTPEFLVSALPQDAIGGGLSSRIVFVYGDKLSKIVPIPIPSKSELELKGKLIHDLEQILLLRGEFKPTEEFLDLYSEWYIESVKNPPFTEPELTSYCNRRALHIRKLAMVMSASRSDEMILREEDFIRAYKLLMTTEQYMRFVFSGRGKNPANPVMQRIIKNLMGAKEITYKQLVEMSCKDITIDELEKVIRCIEQLGIAKDIHNGSNRKLVWIEKPKEKPQESKEKPAAETKQN